MYRIIATFTIIATLGLFSLPNLLYAQESDFQGLDPLGPETLPPSQLDTVLNIDNINDPSKVNPLRDASQRALHVGVCYGGSLSDKLEAAARSLGDSAVRTGVQRGLEALPGLLGEETRDQIKKFADGLLSDGLESAIPIAGSLLSGALGLGGGGGPQLIDAPELQDKDNCLDAIARASALEVLQHVTTGTLAWLTGVDPDGNTFKDPNFTYNLNQQLRTVADKAFQDVLGRVQGTGAYENVCDAFKSDILIALQRNYYRENTGSVSSMPDGIRQAFLTNAATDRCGLEALFEGSQEDLESFLAGDFERGGWEEWNTLVSNNPYSSYLDINSRIEQEVSSARQSELATYQSSGGFRPDLRCVNRAREYKQVAGGNTETTGDDQYIWWDPLDGKGVGTVRTQQGGLFRNPSSQQPQEAPCIQEEVFTPGSVIAHITNTLATSDVRRAELSDEFNEIMADAGNLFISSIFRSGLRQANAGDTTGLSNFDLIRRQAQNALRNAISFEERIRDEARGMNIHSFHVNSYLGGDVSNATDYNADGSISLPSGIVDVDALVSGAQACSVGSDAGTVTQVTQDIQRVQSAVDSIDPQATANLNVLNPLLEEIDAGEYNNVELRTIQEQIANNTYPEIDLHDESDLAHFESGGFDDFVNDIIILNEISLEHSCDGSSEPATPPSVTFNAASIGGGSVEFQYSVTGAQICRLTSQPTVEGADQTSVTVGENQRHTISNVSPGSYTFALSCQTDGAVTTKQASIDVSN